MPNEPPGLGVGLELVTILFVSILAAPLERWIPIALGPLLASFVTPISMRFLKITGATGEAPFTAIARVW